MTPERIAKYREAAIQKSWVNVEDDDMLDFIAAYERAAKLREASSSALAVLRGDLGISGENCFAVRALEVALETKGGEP